MSLSILIVPCKFKASSHLSGETITPVGEYYFLYTLTIHDSDWLKDNQTFSNRTCIARHRRQMGYVYNLWLNLGLETLGYLYKSELMLILDVEIKRGLIEKATVKLMACRSEGEAYNEK